MDSSGAAAGADLQATSAGTTEPSSAEVDPRLKAGRILNVLGVPLMLTGMAVLVAFSPFRCFDTGGRLKSAIVGGSLALGLGVTLTTAGVVSILQVPLATRREHPVSTGKFVGMAFGGLGVGAVASTAITLPAIGEVVGCG